MKNWDNKEEVQVVIDLRAKGVTPPDIADVLNRKFWDTELIRTGTGVTRFLERKHWSIEKCKTVELGGQARKRADPVKVGFVTCFHIPFHDKLLFELFIEFLKYFQPDVLFLLGDLMDWYQVSTYDKNPDRLKDFQRDLDLVDTLLERICMWAKKVVLLGGNHEYRMVKYLKKHPELHSLRCLQVPTLYNLDKHGIEYHSYFEKPTVFNELMVHHGNLIRKHSGWTAKAMFEKYGGCGVVGHSHRGGNFIKRNMQGIWGWYECMCMCDLNPEYLDFADWAQGWCAAYFLKEKDRFHMVQIPVIDHKFLFEGKLFEM